MLQFDHLAVSAQSLDEGTQATEAALGIPLQDGGIHPDFGTHNRLLGLGSDYLEVIAINPDAPAPGRPRWFDLDRFSGAPRLTNWILRCTSLDAALTTLGPGYGEPVSLRRGDLRWRMAVPQDGVLPFENCAPALIEWQTPPPAARLTDRGAVLASLIVTHPRARELERILVPHLPDPRVCFVKGPAPRLTAELEVAGQRRALP